MTESRSQIHSSPARDSENAPTQSPLDASSSEEPDEDALFEALEAEDDSAFRAARMKELSEQISERKAAVAPGNAASGPGAYRTLGNDKEVLDFTTESEKCVVHFSHPDFGRCAVMDGHLEVLAGRHGEVQWAKVDVRECGFVVEKLGVRVLPCVVGFVDGVVKGRFTGFEGLMVSGKEDGERVTRELEKALLGMGILERGVMGEEEEEEEEDDDGEIDGKEDSGLRKSLRGRMKKATDEDDDDDWD
ncbi:MAG: hypothetical protein Q9227_007542 [Pyrenula ochraceoflavens]